MTFRVGTVDKNLGWCMIYRHCNYGLGYVRFGSCQELGLPWRVQQIQLDPGILWVTVIGFRTRGINQTRTGE